VESYFVDCGLRFRFCLAWSPRQRVAFIYLTGRETKGLDYFFGEQLSRIISIHNVPRDLIFLCAQQEYIYKLPDVESRRRAQAD
jgi:hypothetical protein